MKKLLLSLACLSLIGCAAAQTAVEYRNLDIKATTERQIFLRHNPKTLFLAIDNPVKEFSGLEHQLASNFTSKGYTVVANPETADLILNVRLSNIKEDKISARRLQGGDPALIGGSAMGGAAVGYLKGGNSGALIGGVAGLAVGAVADITINSWVHLGILDVYGGVLVQERIPVSKREKPQFDFKESETQVWVRAKQSGIEWASSAPAIKQSLVTELSLLLPANR